MSKYEKILCCFLCGALTTVASGDGSNLPRKIGDGLEVLWDDAAIDVSKTTAERRVHQPCYVGTVLVHDDLWEGDGCDYHNILTDRDEKGVLYRLYYLGWSIGQAAPENEKCGCRPVRVCYAESRDGITWTKPKLGLTEFNGLKDNNILFDQMCFGFPWDNFMVFKDENPDCPPDARYKAVARTNGKFTANGAGLMGDGKSGDGPALGYFLSADGIHFRRGGIVTRVGAFDTLNVVFWDAVRKEYHLYCRGFHPVKEERNGDLYVRDIRHAVSRDFKTWSTPALLDFGADHEDYPLYTNVVQPYPRAPGIFVGFPSRYVERREWTDNYDRLPGLSDRKNRFKSGPRFALVTTDCVFMMSRDGQRFHREEDAFMRPGPERTDNWVYGDCYPARGLIPMPGRTTGVDLEYALYLPEGEWSG